MKTDSSNSLLLAVLLSLLIASCHSPSLPVEAPVNSIKFRHNLEKLGKSPFSQQSHITSFAHGDAYFYSLTNDLKSATKSIYLETFIFRDSGVATHIVDLLRKKTEQGIKVNLLIDAVGSQKISNKLTNEINDSNINFIKYRPIWKNPIIANRRDHRKITIIDDKIAYTGGAGVFDIWLGKGTTPRSWKDSYFKLEGDIVNKLHEQFTKQWNKVCKKQARLEFTPIEQKIGTVDMQSVISASPHHKATVESTMCYAISSAEKEILITSAYICPPKSTRDALLKALAKGVKVTILSSNQYTDSKITRNCAHNNYRSLLKHGAEIYEYQPTMLHSKIMVVDSYLTIVGAANLDYRSLRINDENNLNILNSHFAKQMKNAILQDLKKSQALSPKNLMPYSLPAWLSQSQL